MSNPTEDSNCITVASGPFASTFDYLASVIEEDFIHHRESEGEDAVSLLLDVRSILHPVRAASVLPFDYCRPTLMVKTCYLPTLNAQTVPRLDSQESSIWNMPILLLYEYPIFIQDSDSDKTAYTTNAILRPHFFRELCAQFPRDSEAYMEARECKRAKWTTLNTFRDIFMLCGLEWNVLRWCALEYIQEEREGTWMADRGRLDLVPDPELDSNLSRSRELLTWSATLAVPMDQTAKELSEHLVQRLEITPIGSRLVVGLAGIPASGKSSFGKLVIDTTNALLRSLTDVVGFHDRAILVGLDGWHLTRAQLDLFPEPQLAHGRRGIHWTFDGSDFVHFVKALREDLTPNTPIIAAPSFDHALKDPTPDAISIQPHHRIVLIEGLYTFLSIDPWRAGGELLDERWFLRVDIKEAQRRLVDRHVKSGVAKNLEEAIWRADENDMPNGRFIMGNILEPTRVINSIEDPAYSNN